MHRCPIYIVAGEIERDEHFGNRVGVRLLTVQRRNPVRRLAPCSKASLCNRQQHRVGTDLEKGPATELGKRKHSVTEAHCFPKVPAPINLSGATAINSPVRLETRGTFGG